MNLSDKFLGCFIGAVIGDAIGTTVEFKARGTFKPVDGIEGGGVFCLPPGGWTDDTSQLLATSVALLERPDFDPAAIMSELRAWFETGKHSFTGDCFDIGMATRHAIARFVDDEMFDETGTVTPAREGAGGNGACCRVPALVLRYFHDWPKLETVTAISTALTNNDTDGDWATNHMFLRLLMAELSAAPGEVPFPDAAAQLRKIPEAAVPSSGYAPDTVLAAAWALAMGDEFSEVVLQAANLGDDADSVAFVAGALAGARFGLAGIPENWLQAIIWKDDLLKAAGALREKGQASGVGEAMPSNLLTPDDFTRLSLFADWID